MTAKIPPEITREESPVPAMELAFFFVSCAHFQVVIGGAADSEEQCSCGGDDGYRKCDVCGCISQHSYALTDEDLINDVVECADQHADDGGDGELGDQAAYGGGSQRVFGLGSSGLFFQWGSFFLVFGLWEFLVWVDVFRL